MPFRIYDWDCDVCGTAKEAATFFYSGDSPPPSELLDCESCGKETAHKRTPGLPLPGKWYGDREHSPVVSGGRFDTIGNKAAPNLLRPPAGCCYAESKEFFHTKEYKESKQERAAVIKENKAKRHRYSLMQAGKTIDFRKDKLPGDPKLTS